MSQAPATTYISTEIPLSIARKGLLIKLGEDRLEEPETIETTSNRLSRFYQKFNYSNALSANTASLVVVTDNTLSATQIQVPEQLSFFEKYISDFREVEKRRKLLWSEFNDQVLKKKIDASVTKFNLREKAHALISRVAKIEFSDCTMELLPSESLTFNIFLNDGLLLLISCPFELENNSSELVVYSLFENNICQVSNAKPLDEVIEGAQELMQSK